MRDITSNYQAATPITGTKALALGILDAVMGLWLPHI